MATPAAPNPAPDDKRQHHRHSAYAAEATGLLVMALMLLVLVVIRYWSNIQWSAR